MDNEIQALGKLNSCVIVDRSCGFNILYSTWAFKEKRYPDSLLKKFKAIFFVRGDQQVDGTYVLDTFTRVVSWITVCLLFVLLLYWT